MLRDAETKFLGHNNNSGSDKNYLHFMVHPFVPREARPMLKIDRDGEMFVRRRQPPPQRPQRLGQKLGQSSRRLCHRLWQCRMWQVAMRPLRSATK